MNNQFCEQIVAQSIYFINLLYTLMGSLPDISGTMTSLWVTIVNGLETPNDDYDDDDDDDDAFLNLNCVLLTKFEEIPGKYMGDWKCFVNKYFRQQDCVRSDSSLIT